MPVRKKDKAVDKNEMGAIALAYLNLNEQSKKIGKEAEGLKEKLRAFVESNKPEDCEHSSYSTTVKHGVVEVELNMSARTTTQAKADYDEIINKNKKLKKHKDRLIKSYPFLDTDELQALLEEGAIDETDAKEVIDLVTNFAFSVKRAKK